MKFLQLLIISFILTCPFILLSQNVGFQDDFSDSNITQNPSWHGELHKFDASSGELWLNDISKSSAAVLYLPSEAIDSASWQFDVKLNFSPSGSNFAKVYLAADHPDPAKISKGYFLKIGGQSGNIDDVSLYKIHHGASTILIDGTDGRAAIDPDLRIKVARDEQGKWELYTDSSWNKTGYYLEGIATDTSFAQSSYFIIECIYTSTRADKFYFDNFYVSGKKFQDSISPLLYSAEAKSDSSVLLTFSEKLHPSSLSTYHFLVDKGIGPAGRAEFYQKDSSKIWLSFPIKFQNAQTYLLEIDSISDQNLNISSKQYASFFHFSPDSAFYRDIVINEIYADEKNSQGLPEGEFIELFNASNKFFDLSGWKFTHGSSSMSLSSAVLKPKEYLILCSTDDSLKYSSYGRVLSGSLPRITNSGQLLELKNNGGRLIDQVEYSSTWYGDVTKKDGGYTLEQINPFAKCSGSGNFTASVAASGGTPGFQNSVYDPTPDTKAPEIEEAFLLSNDSILLRFDEALDSSSIDKKNFTLEKNQITTSYFYLNNSREIVLALSNVIDTGQAKQLTIKNIRDCEGNQMVQKNLSLLLPFAARRFDLVINELLFNPRTYGYDFVELYNRSERVISLDNLLISNYENGQISNSVSIASRGKVLFPGEFYAITENIQNILSEYPKAYNSALYQVQKLPAFGDDAGAVFLSDLSSTVIDSFFYTKDMHLKLLTDLNGVSLERVNPHKGSGEKGNFQSAAEKEGFATPGYINSQHFVSLKQEGSLSLDPELFSPDNDGYHDLLHIHYKMSEPGFVASASVYDKSGRMIRSLIKNELVGREGSIIWDGLTDENRKAKIGIYLIYFEAFKEDGKKMAEKKACVLAGMLE